MNVLLVYPEFPDTFWSFKHALRFIHKRAAMPPLGLLTVAAMLPNEWNKRLVDMNVRRLGRRDLEWADAVFVSAMNSQRESTQRVIAQCKEAGVPVVAGGPLFLGEYADFPDVAHFVLNEGEITLPRFLADLAAGRAERIYTTDEFADLSTTPAPLWELVEMRRYAQMCVQFSRGCPFDCDFCNITAMLGRVPRTKSADQIIAELDRIYRAGWEGDIFFVDDNFIGNKRKIKSEILPALIRWRADKPGISFSTEVSINLADDADLMAQMVAAGFTTVFIGIETPDEASLVECSKIQNRGRDMVASVHRLQQAGLQVQGGFIVGFDSDKPSIFERQIEFIQKSGIVTAMVGLLQAPCGTRLYQRMSEEGRLIGETTGNNTDTSMNFIPKMDKEALILGYKRILASIYAPDAYYARVRTFLANYVPSGVVKPHIRLPEISAFFRSIYLLGLKGEERVQYWKLFFWALFRRPKLFPMAITFSIYGFHFRRVCNEYIQ
jgi:radical SAM superfamily enzyme YgiQ (UPF0313 family)